MPSLSVSAAPKARWRRASRSRRIQVVGRERGQLRQRGGWDVAPPVDNCGRIARRPVGRPEADFPVPIRVGRVDRSEIAVWGQRPVGRQAIWSRSARPMRRRGERASGTGIREDAPGLSAWSLRMPKNAFQFGPSHVASFGKEFRKSAYREGIRLYDFASEFLTTRQCCMFAKGR